VESSGRFGDLEDKRSDKATKNLNPIFWGGPPAGKNQLVNESWRGQSGETEETELIAGIGIRWVMRGKRKAEPMTRECNSGFQKKGTTEEMVSSLGRSRGRGVGVTALQETKLDEEIRVHGGERVLLSGSWSGEGSARGEG